MKIYAFAYTCCPFDEAPQVQSLHYTKAGAYRAMMKHKCEDWHLERSIGIDPLEIGMMSVWTIKEFEVSHD